MNNTINRKTELHYILYGIVFLVLFVLSCEKNDNPVGDDKADVIMPLTVGNQWSFIDSTFSTSGAFVRRDSSRLGITGTTSIQYGGATVQVFQWNWFNIQTGVADPWKWLTCNEPDGRYVYGGQSAKGTFVLSKSLSEKFPVTVGDTWLRYNIITTGDSTFKVRDTLLMRCTALEEPFNTSAGTLKCIVYYYQQPPTIPGTVIRDQWLYYVPNLGYVGLVGRQNGVVVFKKTISWFQLK
ncbi:MAG TPA: hypothetical protein VII11_05895 [Bacteroidota bacterium]